MQTAAERICHAARFTRLLQSFLPAHLQRPVIEFVSDCQSSRPSSFRLVDSGQINATTNSIVEEVSQLRQAASSQQPAQLLQCPWFPRAFQLVLDQPLLKHEIKSLSAVTTGKVYFQGLASMLPALCLDARPTHKVLDMCAAPGSKATLVAADAAAMHGKGHLLAVDNDFPRLQRLIHNARRLSQSSTGHAGPPPLQERRADLVKDAVVVGNMTICRADGCHLKVDSSGLPLREGWDQYAAAGASDFSGRPSAHGGPFDRVLVDAPCSSSGRIQLHDPRTFEHWDPRELPRYVRLQQQLLWNAALLLRNGGALIYSTCSLSPEENEGVVQWLLDNQPQMGLVDVTFPASVLTAAAAEQSAGSAPAYGSGAAFGVRGVLPSAKVLEVLTKARPGRPEHQAGQTAGVQPLPAAPSWSVVPGLAEYQGKRYHRDMGLALRLLPCQHHEGFFICKMKKQA